MLAAGGEIPVGVEAGTARGQQHHVSGLGHPVGNGYRFFQINATVDL